MLYIKGPLRRPAGLDTATECPNAPSSVSQKGLRSVLGGAAGKRMSNLNMSKALPARIDPCYHCIYIYIHLYILDGGFGEGWVRGRPLCQMGLASLAGWGAWEGKRRKGNRAGMRRSGRFLRRPNLSWNKSVISIWKVLYTENKYGNLFIFFWNVGEDVGLCRGGERGVLFAGCVPLARVSFMTVGLQRWLNKARHQFHAFTSISRGHKLRLSGCSTVGYTRLPSSGSAWEITPTLSN